MFEAGYVPGILYYLSTFYKRKELATRVAIFLSFNCIAGMISGPIGYATTFLEGQQGMHGWQYLFLIEGIPTTLLSACCYYFMVGDIQEVKWLTDSQKDLQVLRIAREKATSTSEHTKLTWKEFQSAILDWRAWALGILFMLCITPLTGISIFLPTLLQGRLHIFHTNHYEKFTFDVDLINVACRSRVLHRCYPATGYSN